MSNDYILKQVPSKLRNADVTMNISMTYIEFVVYMYLNICFFCQKLNTIGCNSLLIFGYCKTHFP